VTRSVPKDLSGRLTRGLFLLRNHHFTSDTWKALSQLLRDRREELREALEMPLPHDKTMLIRGQISMVKELLDLQRSTSQETVPASGDGELPGFPGDN
jgi:hypothetical protein